MFDPVVDLFRETGRIFVDEKRFFIDGEILRRALFGIGDDRNESAGNRLDAGDRFDLDFGRMAIEVGVIDDLDQIGARIKIEFAIDIQPFDQTRQFALVRTGTGEDQVNVGLVFGKIDGFDENVLILFAAIASHVEYDELVFQIFRAGRRLFAVNLVDAVGDDDPRSQTDDAFVDVPDELRRIMNAVHVAVDALIEKFVNQIVRLVPVFHEEMCGYVFRLRVETGGNRNFVLFAVADRIMGKRERKHAMNHVGIFQSLVQRFFVDAGKFDSVPVNDSVEKKKIQFRDDVKAVEIFFIGVVADDPNLVSLFFQMLDQVHRRDRRAVVRFAQHIADDRYFHKTTSHS